MFLLILESAIALSGRCQQVCPPGVEWQRAFGGSSADVLEAFALMPDGGIAMGGYSVSPPGGNKTSADFGAEDFWVIRMDASGNKLWDLSFGGTGVERLESLVVTSDGGLALGGWSNSDISGNKTTPNIFFIDFWIIRLDSRDWASRIFFSYAWMAKGTRFGGDSSVGRLLRFIQHWYKHPTVDSYWAAVPLLHKVQRRTVQVSVGWMVGSCEWTRTATSCGIVPLGVLAGT